MVTANLGGENMAYSLMMIIAAVFVWQYMMLQTGGKIVFKMAGYRGSYVMYVIGCLMATVATCAYHETLGIIAAATLTTSLIVRLLMPIVFDRILPHAGEGAQFITMVIFLDAARIGYVLAVAAAIVYVAEMMIN